MRYCKLLAVIAVLTLFTCFITTGAFAEPVQKHHTDFKIGPNKCADFEKDPVKALECKKEQIRTMLKEERITKAEADEMLARIDAKIAKINEFNKLTVPQKKAKLAEEFRAAIGKRVKEGFLTQDKADAMIKEFNENVEKWDGKGYPRIHGKWFNGGKPHFREKPEQPDNPVNPANPASPANPLKTDKKELPEKAS